MLGLRLRAPFPGRFGPAIVVVVGVVVKVRQGLFLAFLTNKILAQAMALCITLLAMAAMPWLDIKMGTAPFGTLLS